MMGSMEETMRLVLVRRMAASGAAKAIREAAGLSLSEAAAGAGVATMTVWRWENNSRRPSGAAALRYLALLEELSR
jgi:DNA-binding transcriptional regulator YiaG